MTKLLLLLLSLVTFVYSAHSDHADASHAVVSAKDSSDGHHVREHSEDDHQRDTENGNVRSRNSDKHSDGMVALIDSMDDAAVDETDEITDDEPAAVDTEDDTEDDTEGTDDHPDHETVQNEEDHPDHEAVQNEEDHPDHEDAGIVVDHPDHEKLKEDDGDDTEDHERTVSDSADEDANGDRTDLGELEYAGQGQGDERARGTFTRDEDIEGRHDTFTSPQEEHEEDHEGLFGDDTEEALDEEPQTETDDVDDVEEEETDTEAVEEDDEEVVDEEEAEVVDSAETETEDVDVDGVGVDGVEIVGHLNENRDLETVSESEVDDDDNVDGLGELEYAGQGAGDERARGVFDRDEEIEGRHDTFTSPQEDHVEPAHDDLHDENQDQEDEDELVGEGDVVDERVIGDEQEDVEQAEASEEELVAVRGRMDRVKGSHFVMSTALLVVTGAAMAVLFVHLMTTWNTKKMVGSDPEYTPLIADKV